MESERGKQACILVVDDDQNLLRMVSRALELEGFRSIVAADGNSALALLEKHKPDLVLLDIVMPGLDGFEVLKRIRRHSDVPVIMLTAKNEVTTVRDTISLGADDYIRKPFSIVELLARIRCKLRRAGCLRQSGGGSHDGKDTPANSWRGRRVRYGEQGCSYCGCR